MIEDDINCCFLFYWISIGKGQAQKSRAQFLKRDGSPAVPVEPVVFRPCFAAGLALHRIEKSESPNR
jgi:hypothetical protein